MNRFIQNVFASKAGDRAKKGGKMHFEASQDWKTGNKLGNELYGFLWKLTSTLPVGSSLKSIQML